jgi:hypothetical protein
MTGGVATKCAAKSAVWEADASCALRAAVMLHLRARYVSKAAILTDSATRVPVENRSPA